MAKTKTNNYAKQYAGFLKRKMIMSRFIGILCCLIAIVGIVIYFLKLWTDRQWLIMITISYCMATVFTANSFLQDIKVGNPWQRVNGFCSVVLYLFAVFLIVFGFVDGQLKVQF